MKPTQPYTPHQQPPPRSFPGAAMPQQPPRGNPHHHEYRPKGQAPPPQQEGPPESPQMAGQPHGMDAHAPVFRPSSGFGGHPPPVRSGYNGPVFTPGQGFVPGPGMNGIPQQMRGPAGPHHHQQSHRMRGLPRGAMQQQYMPPPQMGQPYYPPQMPPPYMMNQQYMAPPPPQMQFMAPPPMGMPYAMPMPAPTQAQTHVAPREKKRLEIIDPKTNKPIQIGGASSTSSSTSSAATAESTMSEAEKPKPKVDAPATTPAVEKKADTSSPKKIAPSSPSRDAKQANGVAKSPSKSPKKKAAPAPAQSSPAPSPVSNGAKAPEVAVKEKVVVADTTKTDAAKTDTAKTPITSPKNTATPSTVVVSSPKPSPSTKSIEKTTGTAIKQAKTISPKKKALEPAQDTVTSVEIKSATTEMTSIETKMTVEKVEASAMVEKVAAPAKMEKSQDVTVVVQKTDGKVTYTLELLMSLREKYTELPAAAQGPDSKWPSMEVVNEGPVRTASRGGRGGGGGGGGGGWERGEKQLSRQSSRGSSSAGGGGGNQWQRSQELPKRGRGGSERGGRGGRGGRGQPDPPLFDGPVKPLERTDNRWIPVKAASGLEAAKKKVQSIMNKMTREKFDRLAEQLTNIHMDSLEMLQSVIRIIFDKALGEPHFCDMYADLCKHLDQKWHTWSFLKIVRNDDDNMFYWTTMSDADSEVVGPFESTAAALRAADSDDFEPSPAPANLKLTEVRVQNQKFVKLWTLEGGEGAAGQYYWSGQHMEDLGEDQVLNGPYATEEVANRQAVKTCSFKRILLNACQEEFEKDNIYEELEANFRKAKENGEVTPEIEANYEEKRIIMKGRMLGNIRFIGELYRKGMLQERIMHECIMKLMGVFVNESGELTPSHPDTAPDEENIESLCKLLGTMGKDLDRHGQMGSMQSYFHYLGARLVKDKRLSSRMNFMVRDVIELRKNQWVPRRKELKTKTLDEIRKEAEREQRAPPVSAPSGGGGGGGGGRNDNFRGMDNRRSNSARDGGNYSRSTMAPVYQGHSMNSRSANSNRMTLPIDRSRGVQRDESVKTGPQGRPAMFGASARRSAPQSGPSSMGTRRGPAPDAAASAKKKAEQESARRASIPPLPEDAKEKVEKKAKSIAEEYVSINDIAEAEACMQELLKTYSNHEEVSRCFAAAVLTTAIEAKAAVLEKQVELLEKLSMDKRSLSFDGIRHGLAKTLEVAGFLWCDVPKLHEHVANICVTYMADSPRTGVTLDWILSGCAGQLESDVVEELVDGGFLAAMTGSALKLLAAKSAEKTKQELHNTYITLFSVLPEHQRTAKDLQAWSDKYLLSAALALGPAFELAAQLAANAAFDDVVQWIEGHIPRDLRVDSVFATHACLLILSVDKPGELPSSERCMLLTGFCGNADSQTRLVAAVIQTRKDRDEAKKLLRHLVKEGAVLPPACAKWLELKKDNSVGRKQAVADLGRFIEDLARTK